MIYSEIYIILSFDRNFFWFKNNLWLQQNYYVLKKKFNHHLGSAKQSGAQISYNKHVKQSLPKTLGGRSGN
jgi:hypothetical protein